MELTTNSAAYKNKIKPVKKEKHANYVSGSSWITLYFLYYSFTILVYTVASRRNEWQIFLKATHLGSA